jgi:hypothetical protein
MSVTMNKLITKNIAINQNLMNMLAKAIIIQQKFVHFYYLLSQKKLISKLRKSTTFASLENIFKELLVVILKNCFVL